MSIPTAVFLDTSILDGQQYNVESTALSTFVPGVQGARAVTAAACADRDGDRAAQPSFDE